MHQDGGVDNFEDGQDGLVVRIAAIRTALATAARATAMTTMVRTTRVTKSRRMMLMVRVPFTHPRRLAWHARV